MTYDKMSESQGACFKVPAKHEGKIPILFGRIESKPSTYESSEGDLDPQQLFRYSVNTHRIMERMGYDMIKSPGLNFGKGRRTLLRSFVPKGKAPDYYHKTRRGLGYVTTPASSE